MKALVVLVLFAFATDGVSQTVEVRNRDVYLIEAGRSRQLTSSQADREAVLSADRKLVAFVRERGHPVVRIGPDSLRATDLWLIRTDGSRATRVVEARDAVEPEERLTEFTSLAFSPDARRLYFLSVGWVTSGAVHVVEVGTGQHRFLCAGNSLEVIQGGRYAGHLLVTQHRYWPQGGSYDWVWLLSPDGAELRTLGDPADPTFPSRLADVRRAALPR